MERFDILIVGGGIAGASLGARLAPTVRVLLIEAEDHVRPPFDRALGGLLAGEPWRRQPARRLSLRVEADVRCRLAGIARRRLLRRAARCI